MSASRSAARAGVLGTDARDGRTGACGGDPSAGGANPGAVADGHAPIAGTEGSAPASQGGRSWALNGFAIARMSAVQQLEIPNLTH